MTYSAFLFTVFCSRRIKWKRFQRMSDHFLMKFVEQLSVYIQGDNLIQVRLRVSTIPIIRQRTVYYEFIFCAHVRRPRRRNVGVGNRIKSFLTLVAPANHHRLWLSYNLKHAGESGWQQNVFHNSQGSSTRIIRAWWLIVNSDKFRKLLLVCDGCACIFISPC